MGEKCSLICNKCKSNFEYYNICEDTDYEIYKCPKCRVEIIVPSYIFETPDPER